MGGTPIDQRPDLRLYADAYNTYNKNHLLPSEMEARIASLEAQVKAMREAGGVAIDQLRQFSEEYGSNHDKAYFYNILAAWDAATKSLYTPTPTPPNK